MAVLKLKYGVISTDEHIQEAPDVWTSRMSKAKFGDDIPHIGELPDGDQAWLIRGELAMFGRYKLGAVQAATTPRNHNPRRWEEVPKSTYVPSERLKAMDLDEVDTNVFFPNIAGLTNQNFQKEGSAEFRLACIRAYNDWLAEEWVANSPRFIAQCITPMWDVGLAVQEIKRAIKMGHKGLIWHGAPDVLGLPHFNERHWDPIFQTCVELDIPLCLHIGAMPTRPTWSGYSLSRNTSVGSTNKFTSQMQIMSDLLFSGILDRFPTMRVVTVESGIGWIPYLLETLDHQYDNLEVWKDGLKSKPSEAFRRQVYANFWFEREGILNRHKIGVGNILYETDFPHPTSTWPNSKRCREASLEGVPANEREMILIDNAVKVYRLDVDKSALSPAR